MKEIKDMSNDELNELCGKIKSELKKREAKEKMAARRKIAEIAKAHDISLTELASQERQYRNPDDQWQTWNGKGRKPKWVKDWLDQGGSLDDLEVK